MKIINLLLLLPILISCNKKDDKIETFTIEGNIYTVCPELSYSEPRANFDLGLIRGPVQGSSYLQRIISDQNGYFKFEYEKEGEQDLIIASVWAWSSPLLINIPANKNINNLSIQDGDIEVPIEFNLSGANNLDISDTLLIFINGSIKANVPGPFKNGFLLNDSHYLTVASYNGTELKCTYRLTSEQQLHEINLKVPDYCNRSYQINLTYE